MREKIITVPDEFVFSNEEYILMPFNFFGRIIEIGLVEGMDGIERFIKENMNKAVRLIPNETKQSPIDI